VAYAKLHCGCARWKGDDLLIHMRPGPGADSPCDVYNFDPNNFTVPGLFAAAREWGMKDMVTFSREFGFPLTIDYDILQLADDKRGLKVLEFHPEGP
jgi:hypothetical protein